MKYFAGWAACLMVVCGTGTWVAAQSHPDSPATESQGPEGTITIQAGTKAELAVTGPVWARTAKAGDPLYARVDFPVISGDHVAIPPGTFVQGTIFSLTRPTRRSGRAQIQILFDKIIFANGYVIALPRGSVAVPGAAEHEAGAAANQDEVPSAVTVNIEASLSNDLLLDNGAQIEMTLAAPVRLDARQVADAITVSKAPEPGKFKSATRCRPTPGTSGSPGTPDTVIPGSPGTPSTTIPQGPGLPDIVIPGTPATPPTVIPGIPGTPGFPGTVCPQPPIVVSSVPLLIKPGQAEAAPAQLSH